MNDELEQLKSVLRSLVVSSPTEVTVFSLLRDYKNMIGAPLPVTKYGYSNPVEFLKERYSDCFLFTGKPSNPVLTLIVPDTLKHIDKFVQKQKTSSTKWMPKRRSILESVVNPPNENLIVKTFMNKSKLHQASTEPNNVNLSVTSNLKNTYNESNIDPKTPDAALPNHKTILSKPTITSNESIIPNKPKLIPSKQYITPCMQNGIKDVFNNNKEDERCIESKTKHISGDSSSAVKNFLKKRLPAYDSLHELDNELSNARWDKTAQDDDSGRHTSSSGNSAKTQQLEQLKSEIMELIVNAPEGLWCTDLIRLYRERHSRELNFSRFGFTSILGLVYCLEHQVQITRAVDTGDWLLQERVRANAAPHTIRSRRIRTSHVAHIKNADPEEALPGIDFDPDVFPEDCMHFMESIESVSLNGFRPGAMVEVMIGEVYSPSHFWFIRLGDNYNIAMEKMMDDMTHYYNDEGRDRVLARGAVRVGHYCSTLYEKDWHRSLIVKIIDSDTVKVRHVDYGTVDTVNVTQLKPLRREWSRLPAQAARARLAGVRPPASGCRWPRAAAAAFLALVSNRCLVANVVAVDNKDMIAEVLLIDTSSSEDVCIGSEMIRAGHADTRSDSALRTLDVYLYPRFEALESGATPNYAEIHAYLRDGIALDYVEEYRAHVPAVLPEPPPSPDSSISELASPVSSTALSATTLNPSLPMPSEPVAQTCEIVLIDTSTPPTQPEPDQTPDVEETPVTSEVSTRIPLLLPESSSPPPTTPQQTEAKPEVTTRPIVPPQNVSRPLLPTPPYLSPHAPPYVPGAPYMVSTLSQQRHRAPAPGGFVRSPPPPYGGPMQLPSAPGVTLSLADCETYRALSNVNPEAAHWFMIGAMGRAVSVPIPQRPMHPSHPQMHPPHPQIFPSPPHLHPAHFHSMNPPLRIHPPPGFGL